MKESYRKGVATILTPNHARAVVRLHLKRWTGAYAGWVLSSENGNPGSRRRQPGRKVIERCAIARARRGLRSRRPHARIETGRPLGRARTERPRGYPRPKGGGWGGESEERSVHHARRRGVVQRRSTCEAAEQERETAGGGCGGKAAGQGEHGTVQPVPDAEPGKRAKRTG